MIQEDFSSPETSDACPTLTYLLHTVELQLSFK